VKIFSLCRQARPLVSLLSSAVDGGKVLWRVSSGHIECKQRAGSCVWGHMLLGGLLTCSYMCRQWWMVLILLQVVSAHIDKYSSMFNMFFSTLCCRYIEVVWRFWRADSCILYRSNKLQVSTLMWLEIWCLHLHVTYSESMMYKPRQTVYILSWHEQLPLCIIKSLYVLCNDQSIKFIKSIQGFRNIRNLRHITVIFHLSKLYFYTAVFTVYEGSFMLYFWPEKVMDVMPNLKIIESKCQFICYNIVNSRMNTTLCPREVG